MYVIQYSYGKMRKNTTALWRQWHLHYGVFPVRSEIVKILSRITDEERAILDSGGKIEKSIYSSGDELIVDSEKMLKRGQLIDIRTHTRFVRFPEHRHNYVELVYMCSGETTHIINGNTVILKAGELLLLNQHSTQKILPAGLNDIALNFIILPRFFDVVFSMMPEENYLKDFLVDSIIEDKTDYIHFQVADIVPIQNLIENLVWSLLNKQSNKYYVNQTTMGLLFIQLIGHTDKVAESARYENTLMFSVLRYIDENYKTARLDTLAAQLGRPMPWLSRFIKQQTGKSFTELTQYKRLNQAVFLLTASKMRVEDIITEVGYENASYFHRIFRKEFGMTPLKFRESKQSKAPLP